MSEIVSFIGVALILLGFVLLQTNKIGPFSLAYGAINFFGNILVFVTMVQAKQWAMAFLTLVFLAFSVRIVYRNVT